MQRPKFGDFMTNEKDLANIVKYAKSHCEDRCPADRDPAACISLIEMCEILGEDPPLCFEDTKGFTKAYFVAKVKDAEKKHGKPIKAVLADYNLRGVKTLEDNIEKMEVEFALKAIKALDEKRADSKQSAK